MKRRHAIGIGLVCWLTLVACGDDDGTPLLDAGREPAADANVVDAGGSPPREAGPSEGGPADASLAQDAASAEASVAPGALVGVRLRSEVGVLLDEIPDAGRSRFIAQLEDEEAAFWIDRARSQVALTTYRLVFRDFFYDEELEKGQLPLPPKELWTIELQSKPKLRTLDGHDLVSVEYELTTTLVAPLDSPADAEPALAEIGGTWNEPFVLPVDPELLLQRTGYACMDEEEFPPNSVDGENVATFYDQECEAAVDEDESENSDCHITEHPDESCEAALARAVGAVTVDMRFERLAWNEQLAEEARVGEVTNPNGADLSVIGDGLENNRIIFRYITEDSCAVVEGCVNGTGWRRLLQFDASVSNLGAQALDIGDVDYYLEDDDTVLGDHHIFQYSECHKHYHFSHYGDFVLASGDGVRGNKQAFCLQSTSRYSNNEFSPLTHPYGSCAFQGMQAGWGDDYGAGIECQWVDITGVPAGTADLSFVSNPDGFLCEGSPVLDDTGLPTFEPTPFETPEGATVDRPVCDFMPDWDVNNRQARPVEVPEFGGLITTECTRGQVGPLRDCGFVDALPPGGALDCEPGTTVSLECTVQSGAEPVVVRACDYSHDLGQGVACVFREALSNAVLTSGTHTIKLTCPSARDGREPGGKLSVYLAPILPSDPLAAVECSVSP